jgi:ABC-2 type transport system ATP-binding protein
LGFRAGRSRPRPAALAGTETRRNARAVGEIMPIIETRDLRKVFRSIKRTPGALGALRTLFSREYVEKPAVEGVTMSLEAGELVGYIGPNGAGKSTTIKMLTGILVPTSGMIRVAGLVPCEQRTANARNIGVVFGQRSQLYWDLPLIESFELLRAIYNVPRARYEKTMADFTERLEMGDFLQTPVRQLSLGQRMRGDFAAAMLHEPRIVYLDEPTIGLDVVAKEAIRTFVGEINRERGTTIILTTHDLRDVERLCRRIVLIDEGKLVYDGEIESLKDRYGTHRTLVIELCEEAPEFSIEGAELEGRSGNQVRLRFDRRTQSAENLIRRVADAYCVSDISIEEPELESIIRRLYVEGYEAVPEPENAGAPV